MKNVKKTINDVHKTEEKRKSVQEYAKKLTLRTKHEGKNGEYHKKVEK
jgi:hypothetical protein